MNTKFRSDLDKLNIKLSTFQEQQFNQYYDMIIEWNKVMNLTGITERSEVNLKHFVDSLSIIKAVPVNQFQSLIDIGTGAGFPGIPLKIAFPEINIVLLDSLKKRVKFLSAVIEKLGLKGIEVIHGRAEDYARDKEYREKFDLCVSRAVAHLSTLSEYCLPYVKVDGYFIPYKSGAIDEEVEMSLFAIETLGGKNEGVIKFNLAGSEIERSFIKIKKLKSSSMKYPRKAGIPSKEPLLLS